MSEILWQRFVEYVENRGLLKSGVSVIAGISGGADSVCMIVLLERIRRRQNITVTAVHINHMIRGKSADEDEAFVKKLCEQLNIPLRVFKRDIVEIAVRCGESIEEAGRHVRYDILTNEAKNVKVPYRGVLAVAHHKEDNAETFILNLARGSSLNGLTGMKSESIINDVPVIRPLLFASRSEIESFLSEIGQPYRNDSSNNETKYARNRVRHKIIPELNIINSKAIDHIEKSAENIRQAYEYIDSCARKEAVGIVSAGRDMQGNKLVSLDIGGLEEKPDVIASKIVYDAVSFAAGTLKDISDVHIKNVLNLLKSQTGSRVCLPYGLAAIRKYETIVIMEDTKKDSSESGHAIYTKIPKSVLKEGSVDITLKEAGAKVHMELVSVTPENYNSLIEKNQYTKVFDYDKIKRNFVFGTKEEGDFIRIDGGRKSLRRYFIDEKIGAENRKNIPVLKDDEEVIWIIGHRISEKYKITKDSMQAVAVSFIEGNNGD